MPDEYRYMSTGDGDSDRLPRLTNPVFAAAGAAEALAGMPTSRAEKASNTAGRQGMTRYFTLDPSHSAEISFRLPTPGGAARQKLPG